MIHNTFEDCDTLRDLGLDWDQSYTDHDRQKDVADNLTKFALTLASNRSWSMVAYKFPPYSYAGVLISSAEAKEQGPQHICNH